MTRSFGTTLPRFVTAAALGLSLLLAGCAASTSTASSETANEDRDASLFTKPFNICVQNLSSQNLEYRMAGDTGKSGVLGSGANECVISHNGGTFENAVFTFKDSKDGTRIKVNIVNSAVYFGWQYAFPSGWDVLTEGPIGSKVFEFKPGVAHTVSLDGRFNVTGYSDAKVRKLPDGRDGYQMDLRIAD